MRKWRNCTFLRDAHGFLLRITQVVKVSMLKPLSRIRTTVTELKNEMDFAGSEGLALTVVAKRFQCVELFLTCPFVFGKRSATPDGLYMSSWDEGDSGNRGRSERVLRLTVHLGVVSGRFRTS